MKPRSLIEVWAAGGSTVGAACKVPSALVAESVAAAGFDYVYVDQQHGVFDDVELFGMLQAIGGAGAAPVTRVPANRPDLIHKSLDFGADGVIVPLVETVADAARAVSACRYPPMGTRSYGVLRPGMARVDGTIAPRRAACIALVETLEGIDNLGAIARSGVDAIMVGPHDLSLSLGLDPHDDPRESPRLRDAIERISLACHDHGIAAGIGTSSGAEAEFWLRQGFQLVNVGNDLAYVRGSLRQELAAARAAL